MYNAPHHKLGTASKNVLFQFQFYHVLLPDEGEGGVEPGHTPVTRPLVHERRQIFTRHGQYQLHELEGRGMEGEGGVGGRMESCDALIRCTNRSISTQDSSESLFHV